MRIIEKPNANFRLPTKSIVVFAGTTLSNRIAEPKEGSPDTLYVDLDIDKANPNYDVARFILHVGDLISSKKTNHLKLRKRLVGGATGDFIYYDAVKA